MTGIMGDYLNIVAQKTQLEFKYVASNSWPEVLQKFSEGQIDLVPGIGDSKEEVALGPVSDMYASYEMVIISNESIAYVKSLDAIKNKTFSLPKYYTSYNYIKNKYPQANIIETTSIPEALRNVANKKADIFVGHVGPAIYYINKMGTENLKIAGNADFDFIHHFLVSPQHPELLSIVNKVFATITEKERERIYHDWIHTEITQSFDYSIVWKLAIVITLIILFFIYNNRKLQRMVNTKTEQLQELLKTLESKVQERTVDLEFAKKEIEEIHQHTQDSIEYASLIQRALIPDNTEFKKYFSDFLTIWQPKDVVGGDIYLFECLRNDDECLLMVIDCTGHGVPGAFVTMLVKAIERQVVSKIVNNEDHTVSPALILEYFNKSMKKLLSQSPRSRQDSLFGRLNVTR